MKHRWMSSLAAAAVAALSMQMAARAESDKKPAPEAPTIPSEYRINPGDKLRIEVYKDNQLSQSVQVRPDGKVTLPLIGDIEAVGRTPIELRESIGSALKEYITTPTVTVIVVEAQTATAYVIGEVNKPGPVTLQTPLNVLQALALAGGLRQFADAKNIRILRKDETGTQIIPFNYRDALKSAREPVYLRPGDTVVVPD